MGNKKFAFHPFAKLNKRITAVQAVPSGSHPRRKKKEQLTEDELFGREMEDVLVIEEFRSLSCEVRHRRSAPSHQVPGDPDQETIAILDEIRTGERPINLPDTQEYVEWINPAFRDDIIGQLHDGAFSVQAFLDLHGCIVPEAEEELDAFILDSLKQGRTCVKIIHGRGLRSVKGARLKNAVIKRLRGRYRTQIIAFVTARQCDGGLGALYVLLTKT